ncbi:hypothetical protein RIF29_29414 [Crotalaria pallida]|uniref:Mono-/di-acylglycerol lipase N-terminal domain-containing protein n=1 Tax=Crotalaria pallida TaxID=3830 RepID=A0AAN9HXG8_CROPI
MAAHGHVAIATSDEFEPIPRLCRLILAIYEPDLHHPTHYTPSSGYDLNPDNIIKRAIHSDTKGHAPPYLIYLDHEHREIARLNLAKESDYKKMFDGGYVHHGFLKSVVWLLNEESETLKRLWEESGKEYGMLSVGGESEADQNRKAVGVESFPHGFDDENVFDSGEF